MLLFLYLAPKQFWFLASSCLICQHFCCHTSQNLKLSCNLPSHHCLLPGEFSNYEIASLTLTLYDNSTRYADQIGLHTSQITFFMTAHQL